MNIVVVSRLFTIRESLSDCFRDVYLDCKIIKDRDLDSINLDSTKILFVDIENEDIQNVIDAKKENSDMKVIVFDSSKNEKSYIEAIKNGIDVYITELEEREDVIKIIEAVYKNRKYYDSSLLEKSINNMYEKNNLLIKLTTREKEILEEVKKGYTNKEISKILYITEYTVKKHITSILSKLDMKNRKDLILSGIK